jgi:hypothetical protein
MYLSEEVTGKIPEPPVSTKGASIRAGAPPAMTENSDPWYHDEPWYLAAIADERAFLIDLERVLDSGWVEQCPANSGRVILERAIALTKGRIDFLVCANRNDRELDRRQRVEAAIG